MLRPMWYVATHSGGAASQHDFGRSGYSPHSVRLYVRLAPSRIAVALLAHSLRRKSLFNGHNTGCRRVFPERLA